MSDRKHIHTAIAALLRDTRGAAILPFAILLPVLLMLSFGILEFSLLMFDSHRASEATRRAARMAIITPPVDLSSFTTGSTIDCRGAGGGVTCNGAALGDTTGFLAIVAEMQAILPAITADNVRITYSDSGLGDATTPGGVVPLATVRIEDLEHTFMMFQAFPGLPSAITYDSFETTQVAAGIGAY